MNMLALVEHCTPTDIHSVVQRLLEGYCPSEAERRRWQRTPYYCTAMITLEDQEIGLPAYVHDISDSGIGFIHGTVIEPGPATASLQLTSEEQVVFRIKMLWCAGFGGGWFRSGGKLLEVVAD